MNTVVKTKFAVKPVVAALALAFSAVNAYADPTLLAQPGQGLIRGLTPLGAFATNFTALTTGFTITGAGVVGDQIYDGFGSSELRLMSPTPYARGVIQWGKVPGTLETRNPGGFNVGQNAKLFFTTQAGVTDGAVLNIDVSGNQSQIFGLLESTIVGDPIIPGGTGAPPSIFVANANGIIIGPLGHIVAPTGPLPGQMAGVGLIAADMNNANAINDFIANNNQIPAAPGAIPPGVSYLNYTGALGKVEIQGAIDGSTIANQPTQYILIAGSTVINDGILFGKDIHIAAGTTAVADTEVINGVSTTVHRYWRTDQATAGPLVLNDLCGLPGCSEILVVNGGGGFTNTGTVASKFLVTGGFVTINAADGGITSGVVGDPDQLVGLFADSGLVLNATGPTVLANVVSGYTTGVTLPSLDINQAFGYGGDVFIETLLIPSQPSAITTTGPVNIFGANIVINSTLNDATFLNDANLSIFSTESLVSGVDGDIGAGRNVNITNTGAGGINLAGDVISGLFAPLAGGGSINIVNANKGAATTLAGDLLTFFFTPGVDDINVTVDGPLDIGGGPAPDVGFVLAADAINITNNGVNAPTTIHDTVVQTRTFDVNITMNGPGDISAAVIADSADVNITNNGQAGGNTTTISGDVLADSDINIFNNGQFSSNLNISGSLTAGSVVTVISDGNLMLGEANAFDIFVGAFGAKVSLNGPQTATDDWDFFAPNATTKLLPAAVIQAGDTVLIEALHFVGVNAAGNPYVDALEKPAAQIITNNVYAILYGSINAPIAGNTNWPLNAMQILALDPTIPIFFDFSAIGGGFQAINIGFTGDAFVSSGFTRTPFDTVGLVGSTALPPPLVANGGSSLILNASGNLDVIGNGAPWGPEAPNAFEFPGGLVLIAGGTLTSQVPIYNAWTTNPGIAFQGIWKEAPVIVDGSYNATNLNNWVNYSTFPVTGPGNSYYITQPVPGVFQFVLDPLIVHHNTYTSAVIGGPIDFCPGGFPPYCP